MYHIKSVALNNYATFLAIKAFQFLIIFFIHNPRAKNRERRENVINELTMTERDFCRDLKLTWQAFGLDTPAMLEQRNVDVGSLFGNLSDIIEVSESFLESLQLEAKNNTSVFEENIGR